MADVTFYLLEQEELDHKPAPQALACQLAASLYRQKQACLILCDSQQQAEQMDELLWQLPANAFVPHNLSGEGPPRGTPVQISWELPQRLSQPVVINLQTQCPSLPGSVRQIYDFVPAEETQKQHARDRYKHYRAAGYQLDTRPASSLDESEHGKDL
ncbi:DNA polymerase III subunit chi [Lacimicrobium sp. SS2-24]|uniref:DNA polymerase III subunit chi n=1 Tax=Lacimicrobium sp. SS2-24 TaxID=2005569 RepID=UPI000B4C1143|nr:DNA polymerase III subunit chi [Lacimicrobium sp. SS2-24]